MKQNLLKTMMMLGLTVGTPAVASARSMAGSDLQAATLGEENFVGDAMRQQQRRADEAAAPMRLLVRSITYGDHMGTAPEDLDMTKTEYFYDSQNRLIRTVTSGRTYDDQQDYAVMYLYKTVYAEDGLSSTCMTYQTGLYDYGDIGWREGAIETTTYDEKGRVTRYEPYGMYNYTYEYDESGNLVKYTRLYKSNGNVSQEITYSDFVGKDKPKTITATGAYDSYTYNATCEYDENGNKLSELQLSSSGKKKQLETWEYAEDGFLKLYYKTTSFDADGTPKLQSKRGYWLDENNPDPNCIFYADSTYIESENRWGRINLVHMDEYADFSDMAAKTATTLTASEVEDRVNTIKLTFTMPADANEITTAFNIYRDGDLIATKWARELTKEDDEGTYSYLDEDLYNGDHDYFVQVLVGNSNDIEDYKGYYISNTASVSLNLQLPAVTDLKATDRRNGENGEDIVTFSWTNPEYPEAYGFISNSLYFNKNQLADAETTDPETTSLEGVPAYSTINALVVTRFKYGKALSETITVKLSEVPTGIDTVTETAGTISLNGRTLNIGSNADITVYSFDGKTEVKAISARSIDLSRLNTGAYIISVSNGKTTEAYKVVLK